MANYVVIRKSTEASDNKTGNNLYGICACSFTDGVLEIQNCISNVSDDLVWVKELSNKLNSYEVDPVHLRDIIEDELFAIRH